MRFQTIRRTCLTLLMVAASTANAGAPAVDAERGKHLMDLMSCSVCHSPRDPKTNKAIAGDFSGGALGRWEKDAGVYWPPNLTSDKETGLGKWSDAEITAALLKGVRPDGRELAKVMPWEKYSAVLQPDEVKAIVAYLRTLKSVKRKVRDPVGIGQKSPTPYYRLVPAGTVEP